MSLNFWWAELKEGFEVGGPGSGCIDSRSGTVSLACLDCSRVIVSFVPAWLGPCQLDSPCWGGKGGATFLSACSVESLLETLG